MQPKPFNFTSYQVQNPIIILAGACANARQTMLASDLIESSEEARRELTAILNSSQYLKGFTLLSIARCLDTQNAYKSNDFKGV